MAAISAAISRGGLLSVDHGQSEVAQPLGLGKRRIFWRIVLPQAMPAHPGQRQHGDRQASIIVVLAAHDLLHSVQLIYAQSHLIIQLLLVATIWCTILSIGQYYVERHYARGKGGHSASMWGTAPANLSLRGRRDLAGLA